MSSSSTSETITGTNSSTRSSGLTVSQRLVISEDSYKVSAEGYYVTL